MEQTIARFEIGESTKDDLKLPKRLNQNHKYEEYTIDGCSEDQKKCYLILYNILNAGMTFPRLQMYRNVLLP